MNNLGRRGDYESVEGEVTTKIENQGQQPAQQSSTSTPASQACPATRKYVLTNNDGNTNPGRNAGIYAPSWLSKQAGRAKAFLKGKQLSGDEKTQHDGERRSILGGGSKVPK